ncbi:hypothetical protein PIROE2DRAFT_15246, partial [Piromyces sp. E2]
IKNDDEESLSNLAINVNKLNVENDVNILFKDSYYKIPPYGRNKFQIFNDLILYSENGTVFDFQMAEESTLYFEFNSGVIDKKIVFRNITFYNFDGYSPTISSAIHIMSYSEKTNRYTVEFDNYCYFKNIKSLVKLEFGNIIFDNCYFSNIYGDNKYVGAFIYSHKNFGSKIKFFDSTLENNIIEYNIPLFYLYESSLSIVNIKFINCQTYYGYILTFRTLTHNSNNQFNITIENCEFNNISSLIEGKNNIITIKNSNFSNINSASSIPVIMNAQYSDVFISNSNFKNITSQRSSLFMDQAKFIFLNDTFSDITSSSKTVFDLMYNSVVMKNCIIKNVLCNGDGDNSSLIIFDSGDNNDILDLNNVTIENCKTNGDLIMINGNNSSIKLSNIKINNIHSYGSVINNQSLNSNLYINNSILIYNENINKWKCGLIANHNNLILNIDNSIFKNNIVKSNGGSICFMEYDKIDINISKTIFENNSGLNGGVMYFNETLHNIRSNDDNINDNDNNKYLINIRDTIFKNNNADYFGGVIYSNFDLTYLKSYKVSNTSFIENHAYAGGVIYLNNCNSNTNKTFFKLCGDNITYDKNTAISHGKDFATSPYLIQPLFNNTTIIEKKSGMTFPLNFKLLDKFEQQIIDISKYYSNIILNIKNSNSSDINSIYSKIIGNVCYFSKGICELNNFKIYTINPTTINIKLSLENNNYNIKFSNNNITFEIKDCNPEQIKITDKNNFFKCENPICDVNCPTSLGRAACIKSNKTNINNINLNQCKCVDGWIGDHCQKEDYSSLNCNFNVFYSYCTCVINIFFKHSGILLVYLISLIYTLTGSELGVKGEELELYLSIDSTEPKSKSNSDIDIFRHNNPIITTLINEQELMNIENQLNQNQNQNQNDILIVHSLNKEKNKFSKHTLFMKKTTDKKDIKDLNKLVSKVHSFYTELIFIYACVLITFIRNDTKYYFNSIIIKKCKTHDSYTCGCQKNKNENGDENIINNYITITY